MVTIAMMTGLRFYVVGHQVWNEMMKYHLCIWMLYVWVFIDNITIVHILTMKTESRILKPKCFFVCIDGWMLWIDDIVCMYL